MEELRRRVEQYRRKEPDPRESYTTGCVILRDPFFFEPHDWIAPPSDFHRSIVVGNTYSLSSPTGQAIWEAVRARMPKRVEARESRGVWGDRRLARTRLGQDTFRLLVTDVYERRCAVTRERALPALEAAHIRPVTAGGEHRVDNGLLLRADVHALMDPGHVTVTPDYRFRASRRLKRDFDNGEACLGWTGRASGFPATPRTAPAGEFLQWHADTRSLG